MKIKSVLKVVLYFVLYLVLAYVTMLPGYASPVYWMLFPIVAGVIVAASISERLTEKIAKVGS